MAKKWIIQGKYFKLSNSVEFHYELASKEEPVVGGGWFQIDGEILWLYSNSTDFGGCTIEEVRHIKDKGLYTMGIIKKEWRFSKELRLSDAKSNWEAV